MAYADNKMSSGRIAAIVIVALLHALLGYAFVTGLAFKVAKKVAQDLKTFNVEEPPPPEEEPPPPPPDVPVETPPPPVVSPPPLVRLPSPPPRVVSQNVPPPVQVITPIATPAPPAPPAPPPPPPPAPKVVQAAQAKGSLAGLITDTDYPAAAIRAEEEGTVRVRLGVGANGRVTSCEVSQSSGSSSLDSATCRILRSRARFTPAKDQTGAATADTITSPPITWRLQ